MFTLPKLPYSYDALEPYIDAQTMEIHHTKHHQAYIDKLNDALKDQADLQAMSVEQLLIDLNTLPASVQTAVRNHGGGHANHSLFWQILTPNGADEAPADMPEAFAAFGSYETFQAQFTAAAMGQFGSGWAWVVSDSAGVLSIESTANQDSPLSAGKTPILGLDVWEHAYYLYYQNKRAEYVAAFFHLINWQQVAANYQAAVA